MLASSLKRIRKRIHTGTSPHLGTASQVWKVSGTIQSEGHVGHQTTREEHRSYNEFDLRKANQNSGQRGPSKTAHTRSNYGPNACLTDIDLP